MAGRITASVFLALTLFSPHPTHAQVGLTGSNSDQIRNGWNGSYSSTEMPTYPVGHQYPADSPYPPGALPRDYNPPTIHYERHEKDADWEILRSPFAVFWKQVVNNAWVRFEYMNWGFKEPHDGVLGSELILLTATQGDPRERFDVVVNNNIVGRAEVADLGTVSLRDNNGQRTTLGIPLTFGSFEAGFFSFTEARGTTNRNFELGPRRDPASLQFSIATSTLTSGQVGTNIFIYDESFEAKFTSDLWEMEYNFIFNAPHVAEGFTLQPILGFRILDIQERLTQVGSFAGFDINNNPTEVPSLVTTIDSRAENKIYAPQLGLRMQMVHRWFTLGFEPKIGFGANVFNADVTVEQLRSATDPTVVTRLSETAFSPIGDFKFYAAVPVTDNFTLFVSYQSILAAKISRPHDNILYNDNGPTNLAGIVVREAHDNMDYRGYTIGGELRWK